MPEQRENIRKFLQHYPWVKQRHMAKLFGVSPARISEIVRKDKDRGGI